MPPRFYVFQPLVAGQPLTLPAGPARHVQVLRLQPGAPLTLFNGAGGEWAATVARIGRQEVEVVVGPHHAVERELACGVTLAVGMPANERMDGLVEKATELGVAAIQPLVCERSVLRLSGERAAKKMAHWQGVAAAASEQSGRTRVPRIDAVRSLSDWLAHTAPQASGTADPPIRFVLSLRGAQPLALVACRPAASLVFLSGPEGGLTEAEEVAARSHGFLPISLGLRTLRADTAPLAALAWLAADQRFGGSAPP